MLFVISGISFVHTRPVRFAEGARWLKNMIAIAVFAVPIGIY